MVAKVFVVANPFHLSSALLAAASAAAASAVAASAVAAAAAAAGVSFFLSPHCTFTVTFPSSNHDTHLDRLTPRDDTHLDSLAPRDDPRSLSALLLA